MKNSKLLTVKEALQEGKVYLFQDDNLMFWLRDLTHENIVGFDYLPSNDTMKISFNQENKVTALFF